jgi:hypothetical protein
LREKRQRGSTLIFGNLWKDRKESKEWSPSTWMILQSKHLILRLKKKKKQYIFCLTS